MNSLINRAVEEFLRAIYGEGLVQAVADEAAVAGGVDALPAMDTGAAAMGRAAFRLSKPRSEMFEDLGAWLTQIEPIRRLLRFSGRDFRDFLLRLEELPGRAHLVLPSLQIPRLQVDAAGQSIWVVLLDPNDSWQFVLAGLIRGMADDYGALCLISAESSTIRVDIWDEQFAKGRNFCLQGSPGAGRAFA
ncbi:MAG: heme NO-binding protein [Alphaproteobacteria bacterium]|nr:heme NO-binding protein [Alphaproteobacteria bacterium]